MTTRGRTMRCFVLAGMVVLLTPYAVEPQTAGSNDEDVFQRADLLFEVEAEMAAFDLGPSSRLGTSQARERRTSLGALIRPEIADARLKRRPTDRYDYELMRGETYSFFLAYPLTIDDHDGQGRIVQIRNLLYSCDDAVQRAALRNELAALLQTHDAEFIRVTRVVKVHGTR